MKIEIELDFNDLMLLGANGTLQKGDSTVTINRPVLPEIEGGKVIFRLDNTDPRSSEFR